MLRNVMFIIIIMLFSTTVIILNCSPDKPEPVKSIVIGEKEFDPEVWGKAFTANYESWLKTKEPRKSGLSKYRKGWDDDKVVYDRLSEFPFSAILYNGWGFGVEYNEPRGHFFALTDIIEIDPSRTGPGGVCLACKTPYHKTLVQEKGDKYLKAEFEDALAMIPEKSGKLGPACIDCHKPNGMELVTNKLHIEKGLKMLGKKDPDLNEKRLLACAQCHMTYYVPRDEKMKTAAGVRPPWTGSEWGNISIENIIKDLLSDYQRQEWKQKVTGFKMPFIRHPEFEFFTKSSTHYNAGAGCADCHMPYIRSGSQKISDHNVMSPLKAEMKACLQCHAESSEWLKKQVITIQDRSASLVNRAGYATAVAAKLIETVHKEKTKGVKFDFDQSLYEKAVGFYKQAFLRIIFISAENSMGFHNPSEAGRVLGDAVAFASKSEALLRQILAQNKVNVPEKINLELGKYLNNRGQKKLKFKKDQVLGDPYGLQKEFNDAI
ncbi:MAG: ammonia-forming cytochrome c nitrite reductase subunit c552 [Spirochaetes bacterium]|nr:ammonia-forming cytochrome c nitrite reductase subunit c552 [Spirochaetota bacterium]